MRFFVSAKMYKAIVVLAGHLLFSVAAHAGPPPSVHFSPATPAQAERVIEICGAVETAPESDQIAITETMDFYRLSSNCLVKRGKLLCKTMILRRSEETTCAMAAYTRASLLLIDDLEDPVSRETFLVTTERDALMVRSMEGHIELRLLP